MLIWRRTGKTTIRSESRQPDFFGGTIATISKSLHDHDIGVMRANGERAGEATAEVDQNNPDAGFHW